MFARSNEARAENHVGFAFQQWLQELGVLVGLVLQIGILNEHILPARGGEAGP
jgi:hypothetical protein